MSTRKIGTNTGSYEYSPAKIKRIKAKKKVEEKYWTSRNGPIVITKATSTEKPSEEV